MKKYWPMVVSAAGIVAAFLTPAVNAYAAGHVGTAAVVLGIWTAVCHALPSPAQK